VRIEAGADYRMGGQTADATERRSLLDSFVRGRNNDRRELRRRESRMQLVLILPGLLESAAGRAAPVHAPALADLIGLAGTPSRETEGLDAEIARRYGIARQTDWPLAAIRAAALGVRADDGYWLAADPATLVVGRDEAALSAIVDDLTAAQAAAIVATLNAHFVDDGLAFVAARPDAIFARAAVAPRLTTRPPAANLGEPLRVRLPAGPDAPKWRRWQSEIQMLLHEHPVNAERETSGRPPVNSLWFSFGGTLPPQPSPAPSIRTFADAGVAMACAAHIGMPARGVPSNLVAALDDGAGANCVLVALPPDIALSAAERSWAAPARDALSVGRIADVSILAAHAGDAVCWHAARPRLWQRIAARARRRDLGTELAAALRT